MCVCGDCCTLQTRNGTIRVEQGKNIRVPRPAGNLAQLAGHLADCLAARRMQSGSLASHRGRPCVGWQAWQAGSPVAFSYLMPVIRLSERCVREMPKPVPR